MRRIRWVGALAVGLLVALGSARGDADRFVLAAAHPLIAAAVPTAAATSTMSTTPTSPTSARHEHHGSNGETDINVCPEAVGPGMATCFSRLRVDQGATAARPQRRAARGPSTASTNPAVGPGNGGAYDPSYLQSAYNVAGSSAGGGETVAIVDAHDDPNAAADLTSYRSNWGLPPCTTASGCFRKVDQNGGSAYPTADSGWATEISLDVDMVSALCPLCHILLVEAASTSLSDLGTAVNTAVSLGATVVSNSWGGPEYASETVDGAAYFNHPGVPILFATGDSGYGVNFPASSHLVTAVGGTTLFQANSTGTRNATETAWSGGGSGCSAYEQKPTWQSDAGCTKRTVADVAAVADPQTGVWVYNTFSGSGFGIVGGTSAAAPIVGAIYALADQPGLRLKPAAYPYLNTAALNDITAGANGTCPLSYLCHAGAGYDGPTGNGTPNGSSAFSSFSLLASSNPTSPHVVVTYSAQVGDPAATGTVTFSIGGTSLPNCAKIPLDSLAGAFCAGAYAQDGSNVVTASYRNSSGTLLATATLSQQVSGPAPPFPDVLRCYATC